MPSFDPRTHEIFGRRLVASDRPVAAFANWLMSRGYPVRWTPSKTPKPLDANGHPEERKQTPDCEVWDNGQWDIVEIKGRRFPFTSAEDFPYDTIIVDRVAKFGPGHLDPVAWVSVNLSCTHIAIITPETRLAWKIEEIFDSEYGFKVDCYTCPKGLAVYRQISQGDEHGNRPGNDRTSTEVHPSAPGSSAGRHNAGDAPRANDPGQL